MSACKPRPGFLAVDTHFHFGKRSQYSPPVLEVNPFPLFRDLGDLGESFVFEVGREELPGVAEISRAVVAEQLLS